MAQRITWEPARLPMRWRMEIDPEAMLVSIYRPGKPKPKLRARNRTNGNVYTPAATRQAEEDWGWIYRQAMWGRPPDRGPLGMVVHFRLPDNRASDDDNLEKLVKDAGNGIAWHDDKQFVETHVYVLRACTEPGTELVVWRR